MSGKKAKGKKPPHTLVLLRDCWQWKLLDGNGVVLQQSGAFENVADAIADMADVRKEFPDLTLWAPDGGDE